MKMRKKLISMVAVALVSLGVYAQSDDNVTSNPSDNMEPLSPTYLEGVYESDYLGSNWFLTISGGTSAFVGKPVGHGDLFDRMTPLANFSLGKWFTPMMGGRVSFQGFSFKDCALDKHDFQSFHADFMYNISSHFRKFEGDLPRWDCIPYVGCGLIRNADTKAKPFAVSAGVIARYRVAHRLHLTGELGFTSTWRDFDGYGGDKCLGDNFVQASVGLTLTLGRVGWKRVVDYKPYMYQNDLLLNRVNALREENDRLDRENGFNKMALAEMRKILQIEGLMNKYNLMDEEDIDKRRYPKNNYSGLLSLRARMRENFDSDEGVDAPLAVVEDSVKGDFSAYIDFIKDGEKCIGCPIFFFFKLNSTEMTENAQMINIDEIAKIMKKFNLHIKVFGAADSETGTVDINENLSRERGNYIAKLLKDRGISGKRISVYPEGGIDKYSPFRANRHSSVMLFAK